LSNPAEILRMLARKGGTTLPGRSFSSNSLE
jgi:hypothetical protein